LVLDFIETQDFAGKPQVFRQNLQKQVVEILSPFLSFMVFFQRAKTNNMLSIIDVRPPLQAVGVGHSICWQGENPTNYK
jgi:hypothetical protein